MTTKSIAAKVTANVTYWWNWGCVGTMNWGRNAEKNRAQMPEEFLNLRVPQMMRLLAHKVKKYEELQERIKARRGKL
jgi:hypothetical protein